MSGHITLARCEECQAGGCYDEVTPHTWVNPDDIAHANTRSAVHIPWPSIQVAEANPCACRCGGGEGHHRAIPPELAARLRGEIQP